MMGSQYRSNLVLREIFLNQVLIEVQLVGLDASSCSFCISLLNFFSHLAADSKAPEKVPHMANVGRDLRSMMTWELEGGVEV